MASMPNNPKAKECWAALHTWIWGFVESRRSRPRRDDVVDAILHAEIEGRPVTDEEILGLILLLILGGLETTAGALGHFMIRFCQEPEIPALLRAHPERVPDAVEELLRLEGSFIAIGRTARHDAEIGGQPIKQGEKVIIYWASANRDEAEFADASLVPSRPLLEPAHRVRCRPAPLRRVEPRPLEPAGRGARGGAADGRPAALGAGRGRSPSTRRSTARRSASRSASYPAPGWAPGSARSGGPMVSEPDAGRVALLPRRSRRDRDRGVLGAGGGGRPRAGRGGGAGGRRGPPAGPAGAARRGDRWPCRGVRSPRPRGGRGRRARGGRGLGTARDPGARGGKRVHPRAGRVRAGSRPCCRP